MQQRKLLLGALTALAIGSGAAAQPVTIDGRVVDSAGHPSPFDVHAYDTASATVVATATPQRSDGSFTLSVPRSLYVLYIRQPLPKDPVFARADARGGSVSGIVLRAGSRTPAVPETPPDASLIAVSPPQTNGEVVVSGAPGCVPPGAFVVVATLETGDFVMIDAAADGSFQTSLFAPRGSSILVKVDSLGLAMATSKPNLEQGNLHGQLPEMAGTILRVADPPGGFGAAGNAGVPWTFEGTMTRQSDVLEIEGVVRLISAAVQSAGSMKVIAGFTLHKLASADGTGALAHNEYASTLLTPTGLPIERKIDDKLWLYGEPLDLVKTAPDRAEAVIRLSFNLGSNVPPGFYVPTVRFDWEGVPQESPPARPRLAFGGGSFACLPVLKVGTPAAPRIPAMLLAESPSDGSRGAQAIEDEQTFRLAPRVRLHQSLVIPRAARDGQPHKYRLEPHLPTILIGVSDAVSVPAVPFRFPSGSLTARIRRPDGAVTTIGPAPFVQSILQGKGLHGTAVLDPFNQRGKGANVIRQMYQLSTRDPRFDVQFGEDGLHVVTFEGSVDDIYGNTWALAGTYEIHVARLLSIDAATMPGTPFVAGDVLNAGVTIAPGVAADVTVRVRHAPNSDATRMIEETFSGRANRFGHFQPRERFTFDQPGEYRVDVFATYVDASGSHWTGARTWGGVVTPRNNLYIGHGRRGMVNSDFASFGSPWYFRSRTPVPTLPDPSHPMPPFHSGDVFWAQKSDTDFVTITFQDPTGTLEGTLKRRMIDSGVGLLRPGSFDERAILGELPLFSSRADGVDPHIDPSKVDLWGYSYRFVERPAIAVRELIAEDSMPRAYWFFDDPYGGQLGVGLDGDQPNDFKFHWGGTVLRGSALQQPAYAIYGSFFVLVPDDDPLGGSRIFPPFSNEGGPLFSLKGKDIDLFFHPTGVRPGSILHKGQLVSFTGYSAPPLPSLVTIDLTAPSGQTQKIISRANAAGYFHDPANDFIVTETGVWRAKVRIVFDGRVPSTNSSVEPHPFGDVLGSREGEFWFYVVNGNSPPLAVSAEDLSSTFDSPSFTIASPAGLTNLEMHTTVSMPGSILEEVRSDVLSYRFDRERLAADFPNLSGSDTITIAFVVSGTDTTGIRQHRARQVTIQGVELQMPAQEAWPTPRRRSVRR